MGVSVVTGELEEGDCLHIYIDPYAPTAFGVGLPQHLHRLRAAEDR